MKKAMGGFVRWVLSLLAVAVLAGGLGFGLGFLLGGR